ncbi:ribosomal protein S6 kinase delta-1 isoform X2 [Thrips palmi]|uniref:Ribosomal protein S6 kinase delta-1 isoform X2 n=1 Tax=Thrips palmi TaxID=161013 RepID=A0A6P8YPR6_THRPL|nr:ribosomal protein S6 kinase delta-1 isoform X2 [Thrips palmi]
MMADQWTRFFSVTNPRRHTKGFTVYKVTSTVYPRNCPEAKTEVVVWKRFKEFQKLYKELKSRHEKLYLKDEFPPFSKPCLFGRFEMDVIEDRRLAAQTLLDFVAKYPPLFTSQSCVKFFELSQNETLSGEIQSCSHENQLPLPSPLVPSALRESDNALSRSSSRSTLTDSDSVNSIIGSPSMDESSRARSDSGHDHSLPIMTPHQDEQSQVSLDNTREPQLIQIVEGTNSLILGRCASINEAPKAEVPHLESGQGECSESQSCPETSLSCKLTSQEPKDAEIEARQNETSSELLMMDYITHAGYHISQAVQHESNSNFELAFSSYKAAISCLLNGVEDDSSDEMKSLVQRKTSQYLIRAEQIYHTHLDRSHNTTRTIPETTDIPQIQETDASKNFKSLEAPVGDLKLYKVLGVVSSVILALNVSNNTPYIIKVLHKSSFPVDRRTKSSVPRNVPFMCRLHNFMENERAVFLILEQARGGCLWDHITPYFEARHNPESSRHDFAYFLNGCAAENTQENRCSAVLHGEKLPEKPVSDKLCDQHLGIALNQATNGLITTEDGNMEPINHGVIPDVIIQEMASCSEDTILDQSHDAPDVLQTKYSTPIPVETTVSSETSDILKNSQNLLNSVNSTLSKSEEATKALLHSTILTLDNTFSDSDRERNQVSCHKSKIDVEHSSLRNSSPKLTSNRRIPSSSRENNRSASRERRPSTSRHSRSRIRFSCDDMFEGRARALSKSLDREALHRVDSGVEQGTCQGLPTDTVRLWAAQLILALDALHHWGVIIGDLRPDNLLLGEGLNLVLTYQCEWVCVDRVVHPEAVEQLYAAPEMSSIQAKTTAADWWSYGAILFCLLSGETLHSCHPGGFHSYSTLHIPNSVCEEGANLLRQLLQFDAQKRLGVGPHGIARLRSHPFFKDIEWNKVLLMSAAL